MSTAALEQGIREVYGSYGWLTLPGNYVPYWSCMSLFRLNKKQFEFDGPDGQKWLRTFEMEDGSHTDQIQDGGALRDDSSQLVRYPTGAPNVETTETDPSGLGSTAKRASSKRLRGKICKRAHEEDKEEVSQIRKRAHVRAAQAAAHQLQVGDLLVSTTKPCVGCEVRNGGFFDRVVILITDPGKIDPGFVLGTALNKLAGEDRQGGPLDDWSTLNMSMHVQLAEDDLNTAHLNNNAHEPGGGLTASFSMSWSSKSMGQQQADQIRWVLWGRHPLWERSHAFPDFPKEIPKEKQPIRFFGVARWSIAQLNNEVHDRGDWHILRNHAGLISFLKQYKLIGNIEETADEKERTLQPMWADLMRIIEG